LRRQLQDASANVKYVIEQPDGTLAHELAPSDDAPSYLPTLYRDPRALHRGNARLALSESTSRTIGPMMAGPLIQGIGAIAVDAVTFIASVASLVLIRHREPPRQITNRERGWIRRDIAAGLRFVGRHPMLQPIMLCGTTYVFPLRCVGAV
jgi:hypothetical protein